MFQWIRSFLSGYRFEGADKCLAVDHDESFDQELVELEPYEHPFEVPGNYRALTAMYGDPGYTKLDPKWERQNMVLLKGLPGTWNDGRGRIYCHRKIAPAIEELFRRCEHYGILDELVQFGCWNYRRMKSNRARLSHHARGAAIDVNPDENRARKFARGAAPAPWSKRWTEIWPNGVSKKLVQAFKECGFRWGGDWHTFVDPMHFELVHIHPSVPIVLDDGARND